MKITFKQVWLQNIIIVATVIAIALISFLFRDQIRIFYSEESFLWLFVICLGVTGSLLLLLIMIRSRVDALVNSRIDNLLQTQKLFVELYRNSPVPYVMLEYDGSVTYPNHAALHLFGLEGDSFKGLNIFERFALPEDEDQTKKSLLISKFANGVFVESTDILIPVENGKVRFGLLSIFPYGGGLTSKKKGLMTIVDITKQKEIENAKSEFVSLASHQLRTPISSMKWNLELLKSPQFGELSAGQLEYFDKAINAVTKMNNIIEDFLNVSQLELGTKQVTSDVVDLKALVTDIVGEFEGRIAQKNLQVETDCDHNITTILTDKHLIHMVISNLVSNATKYTPENGAVRVCYQATADGVKFEVADSGVGIPKDDVEKLFTKFFRASNVRKQILEGTGLGLYIVKLAVEKMSGQISVTSVENQGTTFIVKLPLSNR